MANSVNASWGGFHKKHLHSLTSSYALGQTFTPKKDTQKLGAERKMALRPTFSLNEIDPRY